MSTDDTATEPTSGFAVLSDDPDGEGPFTVHGTALGAGDVTRGMSGIEKKWTAEALEDSASSLSGKPIVKNHINRDVDAVAGQVTEAKFEDGVGVVFEGELDDEDLALKVKRGRLDVSPRIFHQPTHEMEENDDGVKVVDDVKEFVNLALVVRGAAPSNEVAYGEGDLSAAALRDLFDYEVEEAESDDSDDNEGAEEAEPDDVEPDDLDDPEQPEEDTASESTETADSAPTEIDPELLNGGEPQDGEPDFMFN